MTVTYPVKGPPLSAPALAAKREIDAAVALLHQAGCLTAMGNGNAAVRVPGEEKLVLCGFEGPLKSGPAATIVVGFDHTLHEGTLFFFHEEVLHLHIAVMKERPEANVSFHSHSVHLIGWALANRPLPLRFSPELANLAVSEIPVSPPAARDDAGPVIETLRSHLAAPALLIGNHGLLAWGTDVASATSLVMSLEEAARFALEAEELAGLPGRRLPTSHQAQSSHG
jgi:L-fuculose-phosphate aldolase